MASRDQSPVNEKMVHTLKINERISTKDSIAFDPINGVLTINSRCQHYH